MCILRGARDFKNSRYGFRKELILGVFERTHGPVIFNQEIAEIRVDNGSYPLDISLDRK